MGSQTIGFLSLSRINRHEPMDFATFNGLNQWLYTSACWLHLSRLFRRFYAQRQYGTVQCGLFLVDHKTFAVERQLWISGTNSKLKWGWWPHAVMQLKPGFTMCRLYKYVGNAQYSLHISPGEIERATH